MCLCFFLCLKRSRTTGCDYKDKRLDVAVGYACDWLEVFCLTYLALEVSFVFGEKAWCYFGGGEVLSYGNLSGHVDLYRFASTISSYFELILITSTHLSRPVQVTRPSILDLSRAILPHRIYLKIS